MTDKYYGVSRADLFSVTVAVKLKQCIIHHGQQVVHIASFFFYKQVILENAGAVFLMYVHIVDFWLWWSCCGFYLSVKGGEESVQYNV